MSNPVCYFDVEIGGQPAGRIEMTVRRRRIDRRRSIEKRRRIVISIPFHSIR